MSNKTMIRFFTIADFEEEEIWLREQHKMGWKLKKTIVPCFFIFESCTPEDVVYRLDYKNGTEDGEYYQMFRDYGWEYCARCTGWLYFRKSLSGIEDDRETEIFSDNRSRLEMVDHILKTRMLPLLILCMVCVIPNYFRSLSHGGMVMIGAFTFLLALYLYLLVHCGLKIRKLRDKYKRE